MQLPHEFHGLQHWAKCVRTEQRSSVVLELILQGAPLTENACLSAVDQKAVRARLLAFLGSRRIVRPRRTSPDGVF